MVSRLTCVLVPGIMTNLMPFIKESINPKHLLLRKQVLYGSMDYRILVWVCPQHSGAEGPWTQMA